VAADTRTAAQIAAGWEPRDICSISRQLDPYITGLHPGSWMTKQAQKIAAAKYPGRSFPLPHTAHCERFEKQDVFGNLVFNPITAIGAFFAPALASGFGSASGASEIPGQALKAAKFAVPGSGSIIEGAEAVAGGSSMFSWDTLFSKGVAEAERGLGRAIETGTPFSRGGQPLYIGGRGSGGIVPGEPANGGPLDLGQFVSLPKMDVNWTPVLIGGGVLLVLIFLMRK
jgi:hypothetical protein